MTNEHSLDKQIIVDGSAWTLPKESDAVKAFQEIETALDKDSIARVAVLDAHRRRVDLLINGATVGTVVLDACVDPRPTETSG
ncbi:hypothetical protein [Catenulispora pinisilvae]|uniref:hypothetical protein n=1 Tax=Catenulispora pinisilvae TaxID=2705253 RepID=UPI001891196E|nr:hypothetical protein [Catenulispora pinisilvae]